MIVNYPVILSYGCSPTVSLETYPLYHFVPLYSARLHVTAKTSCKTKKGMRSENGEKYSVHFREQLSRRLQANKSLVDLKMKACLS